MFEVFNMGVGFCYVVDPEDADLTISILRKHDRIAQRIGSAVADRDKTVRIPERNLVGRHKKFWKENRPVRRVG
jgi:phosphoribosylformylglycinamidine cyclo-ligase